MQVWRKHGPRLTVFPRDGAAPDLHAVPMVDLSVAREMARCRPMRHHDGTLQRDQRMPEPASAAGDQSRSVIGLV